MILKFLMAATLAVSILLGYQFNNVHVPEGLENKSTYKLTAFVVSTIGFLAKTLAWLNIGTEISNFREILSYTVKIERLKNADSSVKKTDTTINGVRVRVYLPPGKTGGKLAALIFYHGGGYAFGNLNTYDMFIEKIVLQQNLVAVSVDYRMAPEHPYPTPTDDCYAVTKYIFDHPDELSIDPDRVVFAGDSAGGNIVAVLTQRFLREGKKQPKLQILIYPWMQMANIDLPSFQLYNEIGWLRKIGFGFGHYTKWYLNVSSVSPAQVSGAIRSYDHLKLADQKALADKYIKYLDPSLIANEFISAKEEPYYKNYAQRVQQALSSPSGPSGQILADPQVKEALLKVFDERVSPGLADPESLVGLPKAHFVICEVDSLKDEGLIYAQRLRQAGVGVNLKYYKSGFHGIISFLRPPLDFQIAHEINKDVQDFITQNI